MIKVNPELDLMFERVTDVKPEIVWQGWGKCFDQLVALAPEIR